MALGSGKMRVQRCLPVLSDSEHLLMKGRWLLPSLESNVISFGMNREWLSASVVSFILSVSGFDVAVISILALKSLDDLRRS